MRVRGTRFRKQLMRTEGRIAIMTDMWTASNQKKGYMAVTAHYIGSSMFLLLIQVIDLQLGWSIACLIGISTQSQRKRSRTSSVTSELDTYLNEDILPRTSDFDILMWWKINDPKYPILQEIARDILVVPITSVASESAFSSGGRLLDPHRSILHESTREALMCTRTWLQDNDGFSDDGAGNLEGFFSSLGETSTMQTEAAIVEDNVSRNMAYNLDDID
ncbi:Putative AC9 transposase [Linum grandiflorum]